jgi:hypothetical protein
MSRSFPGLADQLTCEHSQNGSRGKLPAAFLLDDAAADRVSGAELLAAPRRQIGLDPGDIG